MLDMVVVSHAEDGGLAGKAVATAGEMATRLGLPSAPAEAEALAVARDIALAEMAGARLHFRQVTTRAALDLVRAAKARGVAVTAGSRRRISCCRTSRWPDFRTFARLSPPLRCEADRQAVIEAIADGTIDVIASGHDPRGPEDKRLPFADAAPGMAGAETLLPLTLTLVRDGVIDMERAFDLLAPIRRAAGRRGRPAGSGAGGRHRALIDPDRAVDRRFGHRWPPAPGNTPFDRQPPEPEQLAPPGPEPWPWAQRRWPEPEPATQPAQRRAHRQSWQRTNLRRPALRQPVRLTG
jgi:dihydroorotase